VDNTTAGPNGLPSISSEIVITGHQARIERSTAAGTPRFRILYVAATGALTLNDIEIKGGDLGDAGGGIRNQGGTINGNEAAQGDPVSGASYTHAADDVQPGVTYHYRLEAVSVAGQGSLHGPVSATAKERHWAYVPIVAR
jgi:hypothetical protein